MKSFQSNLFISSSTSASSSSSSSSSSGHNHNDDNNFDNTSLFDFESFSSDLDILDFVHSDDFDIKEFSDFPEFSFDNPLSHHKSHENHKFIRNYLDHPKMTPARLSIIMNYKENNHPIPRPKKRPKPQEKDEIQRNIKYKQSTIFNPLVISQDMRKECMRMYLNVLNSGDLPLYREFLDRFFDKNVHLIKSSISSHGQRPTIKYQNYGTDKLYEYLEFLTETNPDFVVKLHDMNIQTNPSTNTSVIIAPFHGSANKIKFRLKGFLRFLGQIRSYYDQWFDSLSSTPQELETMQQSSDSSSSNIFSEQSFTPQNTEPPSEIQELNVNNYFEPQMKGFTPFNLLLSKQILHKLYHLSPLDLYKMLKLSYQESDPLILLQPILPGFKGQAECCFAMHLNEHYRVIKFELYVGPMQLEITSDEK